jgi:hypothetical protein
MKQLVVNTLNHTDIICSLEELEGAIIYSGHKLAIKRDILPYILHHWYDKFYSRFVFVDYLKWKKVYNKETIERDMTNCFFNDSDNIRGLEKSYHSLLDLLVTEYGKFSKIHFIEK